MNESRRPWFQFTLRTLLLLFVVAASSLAVFGAWGILVFALVLGLAVYLGERELRITLIQVLFVLVVLGGLSALFLPGVESARELGRYSACRNNLKEIALALIEYDRAHGSIPPAYTIDKSGKPMHSWRTQIMAQLEHNDIYTACDFNNPWDAPANKTVLNRLLRIFCCPADPSVNPAGIAQTDYFAVVGPNTAWPGEKPRKLADLSNDASHTVLLVEMADSGIPWAKPDDVSVDQLEASYANPKAYRLSSEHHPSESFFYTCDRLSGVNVALADGSIYFLRTDNLSTERLRQILEIGGFTDDVIASQTGLNASGERLNWPNIAALAVWLVSVVTLLTVAVQSRKARIAATLGESEHVGGPT